MSASERRIAELEGEVRRLRHLLKQQMRTGETLEFEAIVNADGVPLVNLRWDQLAAQLPAAAARQTFLDGLRVCEWADTDAKVLAALRSMDMGDPAIGGFMAILREERGGQRDSAGRSGDER